MSSAETTAPEWLTRLTAQRNEEARIARLADSREWAMRQAGYMRDAVTGAWVSAYVTR